MSEWIVERAYHAFASLMAELAFPSKWNKQPAHKECYDR